MRKKYRRAFFLFAVFFSLSFVFSFSLRERALAVTSSLWNTESDFALGTTSNTSVTQSSGDVTLQNQAGGYTETTEAQFDLGGTPSADQLFRTDVSNNNGGEVTLGNGYGYSTLTTPAIGNDIVYDSFLDTITHLLYVSTDGGLSVINTQGTANPADDTLVITYTSTSTPAIAGNIVHHSFLDTVNHLLYVTTSGSFGGTGLSVINTQNTISPSDDTLVITYTIATTPAIGNDFVSHSFLDTVNHLLYVSTDGGLSVINTQNTISPADDTLVITYTTATTPAIGGNGVSNSFLDTVNHLLYVSTDGGLSVINTQNTIDPSDDTLVITYTQVTTPNIFNGVHHSFLDTATYLLYVSTGLGLYVINTQNTIDPSDDTLVITYNITTTPAIGGNNVANSFLDTATHLLYVNTNGGLSVINTQNTIDPSDDTLVITYTTTTTPAIGNIVHHSFLDTATHLLYVGSSEPSGGDGLSVIDTSGGYDVTGIYISNPQPIVSTPTKSIAFDATQTSDHTTSLSYRVGDSDTVWKDDFSDNSTSEYLGDYGGFTSYFQTAGESNGIIRFSNPADTSNYLDAWIDTGKTPQYFPAESIITMRVRFNNSHPENPVEEAYIATDAWNDSTLNLSSSLTNNEWVNLSFTANADFSTVALSVFYSSWDPADSLEIDWIQIKTPEAFGQWSSWSTPCTDGASCPIDQADLVGNDWIEYRLNLATSDTATTPTVNSVTFSDGYEATGTFTSQDLSFSAANELVSFTAVAETPTGTAITYEYSIDHGVTWTTVVPPYTFTGSLSASSFQWRATLTTTDSGATPIIHSVTLSSTETNLENFTGNIDGAEYSIDEDSYSDIDSKNYSKVSNPKIKGTNLQAKNGSVALYEKRGSKKKKVKTSSVDADGDYSVTAPKEKDGTIVYYLRFTDSDDAVSDFSKSITIIRDTKKPVFSPKLPKTLAIVRGQAIDFLAIDNETSVASYNVRLTPKRTTWRTQKISEYIIPGVLPYGKYTLDIKVCDKAGNCQLGNILVTYGMYVSTEITSSSSLQAQITELQGSISQEPTDQSASETSQEATVPIINTNPPSGRASDSVWWNPLTWW